MWKRIGRVHRRGPRSFVLRFRRGARAPAGRPRNRTPPAPRTGRAPCRRRDGGRRGEIGAVVVEDVQEILRQVAVALLLGEEAELAAQPGSGAPDRAADKSAGGLLACFSACPESSENSGISASPSRAMFQPLI